MKRSDRRQRPKKAASPQPVVHETVTLTDFGHDGRAIGRVNGIPWFVAGAVVGETVKAASRRQFSNRVEARTIEVITRSDQRVEPVCAKVDQCGGCSQQFLDVGQQREQKQQILQRELSRQVDAEHVDWAAPILGASEGYRARARMAIRQGKLGFTSQGSHQHVAITACPVMDPALNRVLNALPELPLIRAEIELVVDSQGVVGAHILNAQTATQSQLVKIHDCFAPHVAGLWLTGPDRVRHCLQSAELRHQLAYGGTSLNTALYPWQFSQVNPDINQRMVMQAIAWLDVHPGQRVLDLFAGSGNFSLPLSVAGATVVAVESVATAVAQGQANARQNGSDNLSFVVQDLFVADWHQQWGKRSFDAILLDPPRAGADQVCKDMGKFDVSRILYVSCNPATLARDARTLAQHGYRAVRSGLMDMFPHTGHIESMTLFQKGKVKQGTKKAK